LLKTRAVIMYELMALMLPYQRC